MSMLVPAGLLLLRLASGAATSISADLILNSLSYGYVTIASVAAVTAFGYYIGCRTDVFRELATTDPLTGLFNRRAIEQQIQLESERAKRYGLPLSLLMIDLDGLKRINDQGGHSAGDRVPAAWPRPSAPGCARAISADAGAATSSLCSRLTLPARPRVSSPIEWRSASRPASGPAGPPPPHRSGSSRSNAKHLNKRCRLPP